jgi:hypothetical protein
MKKTGLMVCALAMCATACLPVTNTYQTARVLDPGDFEATAGLAATRGTQVEEGHVEVQVTAQVNAGLTDRLEGRVMVGATNIGAFPVAVAVKAELIEDTLAFDLPIGTMVGQGRPMGYLSAHPALIGSHRFNQNVEVNASVRASFFAGIIADGDGIGPFSTTVGLGLSSDLNRWAIRPEVGVGTLDFGQQTYVSGGIGVTGLFGE